MTPAVHRPLLGRDVVCSPLGRGQRQTEKVLALRRCGAVFLPDDVVMGGQVLRLVGAKIGMTMVAVRIADGVDAHYPQCSGHALEGFQQKTSGAQAFEVLGQVPVDVQRRFAVDAFVNALDGANEQAQRTVLTAQGERQ
ncbi:hypothetical protein D3C80_1450200 [compost metagenome]